VSYDDMFSTKEKKECGEKSYSDRAEGGTALVKNNKKLDLIETPSVYGSKADGCRRLCAKERTRKTAI